MKDGDLEIQFVPNADGGLKNSYIWFGMHGEFLGGPDRTTEIKKLKKWCELVLKGKKL